MISLKYTIPALSASLKVRKKFLQSYSSNISGSDQEGKDVLASSEALFTESFNASKRVLTTRNQDINSWSQETLKNANSNLFADANQTFASSVGKIESHKVSLSKLSS
jgi:hypothetical protein